MQDDAERPEEPQNGSTEGDGAPAPRLAVAFLRAALSDGQEHPAGELTAQAEREGITAKALRSAREEVCEPPVQRERSWWWKLKAAVVEQAPQTDPMGKPWPVFGAPPYLRDGWLPRGQLAWLTELADEHRKLLIRWGAAVREIGQFAAEARQRERADVEAAKLALQRGEQLPPSSGNSTVERAQAELLRDDANAIRDECCMFVCSALSTLRLRRDELEAVDFTGHEALRNSLRSAPGGWEADRREALRRELAELDSDGRPDIENLSTEIGPGEFDPGAAEEVERVG